MYHKIGTIKLQVEICFPHLIKIFEVCPEKKQTYCHLITNRGLRVAGDTGATSTAGRGWCCHPAHGPGASLRIQVGAPAKNLPVFQQHFTKTF